MLLCWIFSFDYTSRFMTQSQLIVMHKRQLDYVANFVFIFAITQNVPVIQEHHADRLHLGNTARIRKTATRFFGYGNPCFQKNTIYMITLRVKMSSICYCDRDSRLFWTPHDGNHVSGHQFANLCCIVKSYVS